VCITLARMCSHFRIVSLVWVLTALAASAGAQAVGDRTVTRPVAGDPGLFSGQVLNEPQYRVLRDYAETGATRRMHNHPDATFHVFVLLTGRLRLTVDGEAPREVNSGDVLALKGGVMHTFTNLSDQTATIVEVFGKAPAGGDEAALGLALAAALAPGRPPDR
jgi:quercetin dioxygenase-like cupin family protein